MSALTRLSDAAREAGITYRQADHWIHAYYLRPSYVAKRTGKPIETRLGGMTGTVAMLDSTEKAVLFLMADLVNAGIAPANAAGAARHMVRHGTTTADLAPGVRLTVSEVA